MGTFCTSAVFYEPKTTLKYKANFKNPTDLASLPQILKVLYYLPVLPKLLGSLCTAFLTSAASSSQPCACFPATLVSAQSFQGLLPLCLINVY